MAVAMQSQKLTLSRGRVTGVCQLNYIDHVGSNGSLEEQQVKAVTASQGSLRQTERP